MMSQVQSIRPCSRLVWCETGVEVTPLLSRGLEDASGCLPGYCVIVSSHFSPFGGVWALRADCGAHRPWPARVLARCQQGREASRSSRTDLSRQLLFCLGHAALKVHLGMPTFSRHVCL